jgi:hypothetical protein
MKKIIGICILTLFIIPIIQVAAVPNGKPDQQQTIDEYDTWIGKGCSQAQSFVPTKQYVTGVELKLRRYFNPTEVITVSVKDKLVGRPLASVSKNPDEIPSSGSAPLWIEFDFEDVKVTPGKLYYIVCTSSSQNSGYFWRRCDSDVYANGDAWNYGYYGDFWCTHQPPFDLCFKTYGSNGKSKEISETPRVGHSIIGLMKRISTSSDYTVYEVTRFAFINGYSSDAICLRGDRIKLYHFDGMNIFRLVIGHCSEWEKV